MASIGYCGSSFRPIMACSPCNQRCEAASAALVSGYACASSMPLRKLRPYRVRARRLHGYRPKSAYGKDRHFLSERILLANLLQSSRSTLSRGSLLSFLAFKEGMLGETIASLPGFGMAPEGQLSYSSGLHICTGRTPP